jgi:hypothetical protein
VGLKMITHVTFGYISPTYITHFFLFITIYITFHTHRHF